MERNWHPAVAAQQREERLLRTDQAAPRLRKSERQIRRLCENGRLKGAIKIGERQWLIPESALPDYLEAINED